MSYSEMKEPSRIDVIGQNGNDGDHYQSTANDKQEGGTHYKEMPIEPWDVIDTWPLEQQIGFFRGNVLKYTMRLGSKDEMLKEAKKCRHYAEKLVEILEETKDA